MWALIRSKAERKAAPSRPSRTLFFCLVGAFLLTLLPHLAQLPMWVSVEVVVAMLIRSGIELRHSRLPSTTFCGILAVCVFTGIYLQFGTVFGRDAGTAFMTALLAIKFFELRGPRDAALIIFCSFFVTMSSLLYSQAVELFVYCLLMMWVLTALLLRTTMGDAQDNRLLGLLRDSALIFLQALPLTLFFFFFFPRYQGALQIGMNDDSTVGLTEKVEPGSIARLADDDSTAMTVKLTGAGLPSTDTMYWRAIILWNYNRGAWTPGALENQSEALPREERGSGTIVQEITIWPHFHRWLFALDYPVTLAKNRADTPSWSEALNGSVLRLGDKMGVLTHKERYVVISGPRLADENLTDEFRAQALQLPLDQIDPQVRALADKLKTGCKTEDDYIRSVLHYFRHGGFVYSDTPGPRGKNALANFLLRNKTGFCEHYASAFAVLMRLEGYPARLVVGYQGAQFNPYKNIYVVKQSNAHSWDEVWFEGEKHWRRIDPTAILPGGEVLAASSAGAGGGISFEVAHHYLDLPGRDLPPWLRRAMLELQLRREEVEADWNDWIFSYDPETQGRLAAALGLGEESRVALVLVCAGAVVLCGVIFGLTMKRRPAQSPVEDFYAKFCRSLEQRGVPREEWEGPLAYTGRVAEVFPEKRGAIGEAGRLVAETRYGASAPSPTPAELKSLLVSATPDKR